MLRAWRRGVAPATSVVGLVAAFALEALFKALENRVIARLSATGRAATARVVRVAPSDADANADGGAAPPAKPTLLEELRAFRDTFLHGGDAMERRLAVMCVLVPALMVPAHAARFGTLLEDDD